MQLLDGYLVAEGVADAGEPAPAAQPVDGAKQPDAIDRILSSLFGGT